MTLHFVWIGYLVTFHLTLINVIVHLDEIEFL